MKNRMFSLVLVVGFMSVAHGFDKRCNEASHKYTKKCVEALAQRCDRDWQDAIPHGGNCLEFAMKYDEDKRYKEMAMVAYKRALLLPKYEGGAYMSYFPIVDMDFEEEARDVRFKSLDDMHAKRLTKSAFEKYICGEEKAKACKRKMDVFMSLNEYIFSSTYHPYYEKHPDKDHLSKAEQKMLMQEHIKKNIKKRDLKWVEVLKKEGKIDR